MGWKIVLQPNGFFARFSTVVDNFTHLNFSEAEMTSELTARYGAGVATSSLVAAKLPENATEYRVCLKMILANHGEDAYKKATREISRTPPKDSTKPVQDAAEIAEFRADIDINSYFVFYADHPKGKSAGVVVRQGLNNANKFKKLFQDAGYRWTQISHCGTLVPFPKLPGIAT